LTDDVRVSDLRHVFAGAASHKDARMPMYEWTKAHWDQIRAKLAGPLARGLVYTASLMCTQKDKDDAQAFLQPRIKDLEGAHRIYDESLEQASLCVALRQKDAEAVTAYFAKKR